MSDAALTIRSTYSVLGRSCATGTTRGGIIQLMKRMNADILGSYLHQWILDTKTKKFEPKYSRRRLAIQHPECDGVGV